MAKQPWVNVDGAWRRVINVWMNVNGEWRDKVVPAGNVNGVWKEFMQYQEIKPPTVITLEVTDIERQEGI